VKNAEDRTWETVRRAYEARAARPSRRRLSNTVLLAGAAAVLAAAVLSPPGRAVFERVREAVGVEHAAPALFSLPSQGRLLVVSTGHGGVWLVHANGLKRRIGSYDDAEWSPHGLFLVATHGNELEALEPSGTVRWTLTRRDPSSPRWEGTRTDTRIAYLTRSGLRVVAGDGTGDHLLDRLALQSAPAWDPGRTHTVAYLTRGAIVLRDADSGRVIWRAPVSLLHADLEWSDDGKLLAVRSRTRITVLDANGHELREITLLGSALQGMAFEPGTHRLAVTARVANRSEVRVLDVDRPGAGVIVFAGPGSFGDIAWSPAGAWLLVTWPTANQWVFLHDQRVHAVGNIREQFPRADDVPPSLQLAGRWCCNS
jgi:dipeptidyl aminopeptidase/acylaminoacyl peptidase